MTFPSPPPKERSRLPSALKRASAKSLPVVRLELEHLDDKLGVRAAQLTNRRRNERREGAGEGGEAQARRAGAQVLHGGLGAAKRGEHVLDVRAHERAGRGGTQRALRPVDQ